MKMPLVSIIIPIFKVEKYINECVDSVLKQTYTNLEVILVDDGSPDSCPLICDEYLSKDKRIRVVHKKNGGLSSARNSGLEIATGEYIMFIDSDDFIKTTMVSSLLEIALKYDLDIVGSSILKYCNGKVSKISDSLPRGITIFDNLDALKWMLLSKIDVASWNKLYRKSVLTDHWFPLGRYNEDVIFLFYLYLDRVKIGYTNECFYFYRTTQGGLTQTFTKKKFDVLSNAKEMNMHLHTNKIEELYPAMQVYQDVCNVNILTLMHRYGVQHIFVNEYVSIIAYLRKNCCRIIFRFSYSLKIKIKTLYGLFISVNHD